MTTAPIDILVIDDDDTDRMALRRHLARAAFPVTVFEAATGNEGAALMAQRSFACVFLDYRLPDMDGLALLQRFYDVDTDLLPAPFVMMTGEHADRVMSEALRWGVHDFIVKAGITFDTLMIALHKAREIFDLKRLRKDMEEKLRHAQKMDAVGQLTSGIAHDFNNLLTVILGNTRIMTRRLEGLEDAVAPVLAQKVAAVEGAARRGADLVRHLMIFTRQQEVRQETIDGNLAVSEGCLLLERALGGRVELKLELSPAASPVSVDKTMLENALINIAVNARDAMPQGGILTVTTGVSMRDGAPFFAVTMADTGTGMPEHVRQRIFEPFYTTKPAGEGTGLGLAMVYGFIRQSGGHIEVDSKEGTGTQFRIYLPLHAEQGETCQPNSA